MRLHHGAPAHPIALALRVDGRRDVAAAAQLREIDEIEGGDARAHAVELHAAQQAPLDDEVDESLLLDDVQHESRVLAVVGHQRSGVLTVEPLDLGDAVPQRLVDELASAEQLTRGGLERVVVQRDERVAHERDAVEHHAARDLGAAGACKGAILRERHRTRYPAEPELRP